MSEKVNIIAPQKGFQEACLSCSADIAFFGGSAGCGKTTLLLLEALRNTGNRKFRGVIFRRESTQITNAGSIWDASKEMYSQLPASHRPLMTIPKSVPTHTFPTGASISFNHLNQENDVFSWQGSEIDLIQFDELTHFCLHKDTEILTSKGWVLASNVNQSDTVASLDCKGNIVYEPVLNTWSFDYKGNMIEIDQTNGLKFSVTPNHRMVVENQGEGQLWKFKEAKDLKTDSIPRTGEWAGIEQEWYQLPIKEGQGYGINRNSIENIKMDYWLDFLGWYLSEGCCYRQNKGTGSPIISIRQTTERNKPIIRTVLDNLSLRYNETKEGQFIICSGQLYDELKQFGHSRDKFVPRYIFSLSKRQINIFLNAFILGDGFTTINKKGSGHSITSASEKLIDDLQELCFLSGRIATKRYNKVVTNGKEFDSWMLGVSNETRGRGLGFTMIKKNQIQHNPYDDKVYCIEVKNTHNFLARYKGRCFFTGNSQKQFWYMTSRNRSTSGVKPYIRATMNPQGEGWVKDMIAWYLYPDDCPDESLAGYPRLDRAGVIRYFTRFKDMLVWGDTREEVIAQLPSDIQKDYTTDLIKSFTFIPGLLSDNMVFMQKDPAYKANLLALDDYDRQQLLGGRWLKASDDVMRMCHPNAIKDIFTNDFVQGGNKYITADIALEGNDKFTVGVWDGWRLFNLSVIPKSDGKEVLEFIRKKANQYGVPVRNIAFDADGVGGFLTGFFRTAVAFHGNGTPYKVFGETQNYENARAQIFYYLARIINNYECYADIPPALAAVLEDELNAIRKAETGSNMKLKIISKAEIKAIIKRSPDIADMYALRAVFDLMGRNTEGGRRTSAR